MYVEENIKATKKEVHNGSFPSHTRWYNITYYIIYKEKFITDLIVFYAIIKEIFLNVKENLYKQILERDKYMDINLYNLNLHNTFSL